MTLQIIFRSRFPIDTVGIPAPAETIDTKGRSDERYLSYIRQWEELFDVKAEQVCDPEDWLENAVWLLAALKHGLPTVVMYQHEVVKCFNTDKPIKDAKSIFFGTETANDPILTGSRRLLDNFVIKRELKGFEEAPDVVWPKPGDFSPSYQYHKTKVFQELCGRKNAPVTYDAEIPENNTLVEKIDNFILEGIKNITLKVMTKPKHSSPKFIEFSEKPNMEEIDNKLLDALDYNLIHLDGVTNGISLQETIKNLISEYRFVVINGVPITGAGCVERYCPANNWGEQFDAHVEMKRNTGTPIQDPGTIQLFKEYARKYAAAAKEEGILNYTLDVGYDLHTKSVQVIETNPANNFGLYAMNIEPVVAAIIDLIKQEEKITNEAA